MRASHTTTKALHPVRLLAAGAIVLAAGAAGCNTAESPKTAAVSFASVAIGGWHGCGLTFAGAADCWGSNGSGEVGNGDSTDVSAPAAVTGAHVFTMVSAGFSHSCGLVGGAAYCWGANADGQLGTGAITGPQNCNSLVPGSDCSTSPVAVTGGFTFRVVSAGGEHTCAVTTTGLAYCWGLNTYGQLGGGSASGPQTCGTAGDCSGSPVAVAGGFSFVGVSAGAYHTCGLTTAGVAYCWGRNREGELGSGDTVDSRTPVPVSGGLTFAALSAGGYHTCGLTPAGKAYCWGRGNLGELGTGDTLSSLTPTAVSGGLAFASVSAGGYHTCGLTPVGQVYCWGYNAYGELGKGDTTTATAPVQAAGGLTFAAIGAGYYHTCALSTSSTAYCWGDNANGQLGNGSGLSSASPVVVGQ